MYKLILKNFNSAKSFLAIWLPSPVKKEYKLMKSGIDSFVEQFNENYYRASSLAKCQGKTRIGRIQEGVTTAIAKTHITKAEIPTIFAIAGGCAFPFPFTTEAGYAIGRIVTSKPAVRVFNAGNNVVRKTYSKINGMLRV